MYKCLHLTNTSIEMDSRIIKEINALAEAGYKGNGFGIVMDEGQKKSDVSSNAKIIRYLVVFCQNIFQTANAKIFHDDM